MADASPSLDSLEHRYADSLALIPRLLFASSRGQNAAARAAASAAVRAILAVGLDADGYRIASQRAGCYVESTEASLRGAAQARVTALQRSVEAARSAGGAASWDNGGWDVGGRPGRDGAARAAVAGDEADARGGPRRINRGEGAAGFEDAELRGKDPDALVHKHQHHLLVRQCGILFRAFIGGSCGVGGARLGFGI